MGNFEIFIKSERMKKLNTNFNIALLINIFALGLVLLCCDLKYEVSDDFVMSTIISGAYGKGRNPHLIFSNILLGYMLLPFYKLIPQISWYFVMHIAVIFISSTIVTFLLVERLERMKAVMLAAFLILFFSNDMYILVQFTKTAMFAVMAGSLLFLDALFHEKRRWRLFIGGAVCIVGTWIRFATVYIAGGFLILILICEGIYLVRKTNEKKILLTRICRVIMCGCILVGSAFGAKKVDQLVYDLDEQYAFFREYGTARAGIVDYTDYGYEAYAEKLEEIGISENDYMMMKKWCFADNNIFSLCKMSRTAEIISEYNMQQWKGWENLIERIQERKVTNYPVFLANILLLFIGFFLCPRNVWKNVCANGVGWSYIVCFFVRERLVYRVEFSVFLGIFLCVLYFWTREEELKIVTTKKGYIVIIVILFVMKGIVYLPDRTYQDVTVGNKKEYIEDIFFESGNYDARKYRKVINKIDVRSSILDEIHKSEDKFYFLDFSTTIQTLYYEWNPWKSLEGEYRNYLYLAGVTSNFPDMVELCENKNITNPLKSLVDEDVYLIDNNNVELKVNYLREHYFPEVRAKLYKKIDGYQIWKLYRE